MRKGPLGFTDGSISPAGPPTGDRFSTVQGYAPAYTSNGVLDVDGRQSLTGALVPTLGLDTRKSTVGGNGRDIDLGDVAGIAVIDTFGPSETQLDEERKVQEDNARRERRERREQELLEEQRRAEADARAPKGDAVPTEEEAKERKAMEDQAKRERRERREKEIVEERKRAEENALKEREDLERLKAEEEIANMLQSLGADDASRPRPKRQPNTDLFEGDLYYDEENPATSFEALRRAQEPGVIAAVQDIVEKENRMAAEDALREYHRNYDFKPVGMSDQEAIVLRLANGDELNACEKAFRDMQSSGEGTVPIDEVLRFFSELHPEQRPIWAQDLPAESLQRMRKTLRDFDLDGDQELSLEEMTEWWYSHPSHPEFYPEIDRLGGRFDRDEDYRDHGLPQATSFEALRRAAEPRVQAALEKIVTDEMRDASEEAAESLEEKLEEKPEGITDHEWLLRREKSGEHLAACDRAFRDMRKKRSGNVTIAEIVRFIMELEPEKRPVWAKEVSLTQQNRLKKTLATHDKNSDNELSISEFHAWWYSHPGHEQAYGDRGVHTLTVEAETPRSPARARPSAVNMTVNADGVHTISI